jgi:hypothetical protein
LGANRSTVRAWTIVLADIAVTPPIRGRAMPSWRTATKELMR